MSLFAIQAAADAWLAQNLTAAYAADPRVQSEWWYPLATSIRADEFRPLQDWFVKVDKDKSGTLELNELVKAKWPGGVKLDEDTCKHLMRIFDIDLNGSIGFYEYLALMKFVELSMAMFKKYDADKSGSLELKELMKALPELGFDLTERSCKALMKICGKGTFKPKIQQAQFIGCAAYLGQIRSIYQHGFKQAQQQAFQRVVFAKFINLVMLLVSDA